MEFLICFLVFIFVLWLVIEGKISNIKGNLWERHYEDSQMIEKVSDLDEEILKEPEKPFTIEHHPFANLYYPKYYDAYLVKNADTGLIETRWYLENSLLGKPSEKEAEDIIHLFGEQCLKQHIIIIQK